VLPSASLRFALDKDPIFGWSMRVLAADPQDISAAVANLR